MESPVEIIRKRMFGQSSTVFGCLNSTIEQLQNVLIENCEKNLSDSLILCGPVGSGKTLVINKIINALESRYKDEVVEITTHALLHTEASLINEILSQLNDEWLSLHSKEKNRIKVKQLGAILKEGLNKKAVILTINDIDLLCSFKRQRLLYVLFDSVRSAKYSLVVIGTTLSNNVVNILEKRVQSRFSQRIILTYPTDTFDDYFNHLKNILFIPSNDTWNTHAQSALDGNVEKYYKRLFNQDNTIGKLYQTLYLPLNSINTKKPYLSDDDFKLSFSLILASFRALYLFDFPKNEILLLAIIRKHLQALSISSLTRRDIFIACNSFFKSSDGDNIKLSHRDIEMALESLIDHKIIVSNNLNYKTVNACERLTYSLCYIDSEILNIIYNHKNIPLNIELLK